MFRRILGIVFLVISLGGLAISGFGAIASRQIINDIGTNLETTLQLTAETVATVTDTLELTKNTVDQVQTGVNNVALTAINVSEALSYTQPLLTQVTQVAAVDVPDSLDSAQQSIPDIAEAAGAIDTTLRILDQFEINRQVFGIPLQFDLGIDYQPSKPLDETVTEFGNNLEGVPDTLRGLEPNLTTAGENLAIISANLKTISDDLGQLNTTVDEIAPLLDEYIRLGAETEALLAETQATIDQRLAMAELLVTVVFIWLALFQIVPAYLGWDLLTGPEEKNHG